MTLDSTGFTPKALDEIKSETEISFRKEFGPTLLLTPDTILGKMIGVNSEREDQIWQLLQSLYDSFSPDTASDISLDRIASITGVSRNPATRSLVSLYLAGNNGTSIPIGTIVGVEGSVNRFRTLTLISLTDALDFAIASATPVSCTITRSGGTATVMANGHGMPNGAIVTISGADQADYNVTAKISNSLTNTFDYPVANAPTTPATGSITFVDEGLAQDPAGTLVTVRAVAHGLSASDIRMIAGATQSEYNRVLSVVASLDVDHFTFEGTVTFPATPATGSYEGKEANLVTAESVDTGAIAGLEHTINDIINSISGWVGVDNLTDAVLGAVVEDDATFRERRRSALQGLGNATLEALRGDMLLITGVTAASIFENDTDLIIGIRTPHSIEAVVSGGADQDIWDALFDSKAAGIATVGAESGSHTDSQGTIHTVKFSRPTIRDIWIEINVTVNSEYPADGDTQVANALKAFGDTHVVGQDVIPIPQLIGTIDQIPGILDVAIGVLDTADGGPDPSPTPGTDDGPITISETDIAEFAVSRITVTQV